MPERAVPFAIALGLIVATVIVSWFSAPKLEKAIDEIGVGAASKNQILRGANWYSDSTQALGFLVPPVVGLSVGAASGSEKLILLYWAIILIVAITLLVFGFGEPMDYGSRINGNIPITPLLIVAVIVNAAALAIAWNVHVQPGS